MTGRAATSASVNFEVHLCNFLDIDVNAWHKYIKSSICRPVRDCHNVVFQMDLSLLASLNPNPLVLALTWLVYTLRVCVTESGNEISYSNTLIH